MKNAQVSDHVICDPKSLPPGSSRKGIVVGVRTMDDDTQFATIELEPGMYADVPVSKLEMDPLMNSYDEDA